jgi:hypothetical protein
MLKNLYSISTNQETWQKTVHMIHSKIKLSLVVMNNAITWSIFFISVPVHLLHKKEHSHCQWTLTYILQCTNLQLIRSKSLYLYLTSKRVLLMVK